MDTFRNYTYEELIAAWERNETFRGNHANMEKVRLYFTIKRDLEALMGACPDILAVNGYDPNPREKHAVIWADLRAVAMFDDKEAADALSAIIRKADGIVLSTLEDGIRISFSIRDIWMD